MSSERRDDRLATDSEPESPPLASQTTVLFECAQDVDELPLLAVQPRSLANHLTPANVDWIRALPVRHRLTLQRAELRFGIARFEQGPRAAPTAPAVEVPAPPGADRRSFMRGIHARIDYSRSWEPLPRDLDVVLDRVIPAQDVELIALDLPYLCSGSLDRLGEVERIGVLSPGGDEAHAELLREGRFAQLRDQAEPLQLALRVGDQGLADRVARNGSPLDVEAAVSTLLEETGRSGATRPTADDHDLVLFHTEKGGTS